MACIERDEAIKAIRTALRRRSGKSWSVRGGKRGSTAWGWIRISSPSTRRDVNGDMAHAEAAELEELLGLGGPVHSCDGISVPSGADFYREFVDRAEGRTPSVIGEPYWD
jgi:hypothetical protein